MGFAVPPLVMRSIAQPHDHPEAALVVRHPTRQGTRVLRTAYACNEILWPGWTLLWSARSRSIPPGAALVLEMARDPYAWLDARL